MSDPIIRTEKLGKAYKLGLRNERHATFRDALIALVKSPWRRLQHLREGGADDDMFWALREATFEVERGSVVGIVGRNGAGKSTLLKILSRITDPTIGRAHLRGRVASLLEVGTGFHPELSGRENIYLNGSILDMCKAEIDRKFDEIVAFADVEEFLDTPVKRYSSGMYVRLAFAVAAHLEPEILVVDEVLAVGDMEFQKRCLGKMRDVARHEGRTVLFVSHNMAAVRNLCQEAILLEAGKIVEQGEAGSIVDRYCNQAVHRNGVWKRADDESPAPPLVIRQIEASLQGQQPSLELVVRVHLESTSDHAPAFLTVDIFEPGGGRLMQAVPTTERFVECQPDAQVVEVAVELPPMIPGMYTAGAWVGTNFDRHYDSVEEAVAFEIAESPTPGRIFPHSRDQGYCVPHSHVCSQHTLSAGVT